MAHERTKFSKLANFQDRQKLAWYTLIDPLTKYLLFGGAAGGGKSYFLRWTAIGLAMYYAKEYGIEGVPIGLFSEDYPTLRDRQITKIAREVPPWLGELKETKIDGLCLFLTPAYGSGKIMLRNLDDPSKYASVEFAAIGVEELTKNVYQTFEDLRNRMRFPGIIERKFFAATNPGEVGHGWVKRLFVKPDLSHPDVEQERFKFIRSLVTDNKFNPDDYILQLQAIRDPQKRKALLEGDWEQFAGQYFEEWREPLHIIKPFIPYKSSIFVGGMDWGRVGKPSDQGAFFFEASVIEKIFPVDGTPFWRVRTFLEVYGKDKTPAQWAEEITQRLKLYGLEIANFTMVRGDPAMWTKGQDNSISIADQFGEADEDWKTVLKPASNDRIGGWTVMHEWLSIAPDGLPYWQIAENCRHLIRTLPELVHDETIVEDVDTEGEDHPGDGSRYMFKHLKWIDGSVGAAKQRQEDGGPKIWSAAQIDRNSGMQLSVDTDKFR